MYYLLINNQNQELKELFPEGIPSFGATPDDFIEIYDELSYELIDVQPAFRVNVKGLTTQQELRLFNLYAANADDPQMIVDSFQLLEHGWVTIPVEEVESVLWREGERVFAFGGDLSAAIAN
ncbi:hypothetical protein [Kamptonema sp. UHCC 0994]|uniref:hypothetical protein n=1 Tax=Kamptonema sp. UHCC 0994 TaxID=3031329 RepID=UPI0023B9D84F|nr:hypothetical protein [Kamptonema sp. UHCC 0994]MDF0552628.1 hypothetical protein [Kamptonema sp. UHCC 0994]